MIKLKNITIYFFLIALCVLYSCQNDSCDVDYKFVASFKTDINTVLLKQVGFPIEYSVIANAHRNLELLTKHKSKVNVDHDSPYHYLDTTLIDLSEDIMVWENWLEDNRCHFDMKMAQKVFDDHYIPLPDYNDSTVFEMISIGYPSNYSKEEVIRIDSIEQMKLQAGFHSLFQNALKRSLH